MSMTAQSVAMTVHFPDQLAFVHLDQHGLHLHSFGWYLIPGKLRKKKLIKLPKKERLQAEK
ncbi:hypothetical protein PS15m_009705 [Mucor circinelloides]